MTRFELLRMIYGYILLVSLVTLILIIGVGHVEEKTSYGLTDLIGILAVLAGQFGQWAFANRGKNGGTTGGNIEVNGNTQPRVLESLGAPRGESDPVGKGLGTA